jgi:hypothetical protein
MPLKTDEHRHNKATEPTTTPGICVPRRPEHGHILSHRIKEDLA